MTATVGTTPLAREHFPAVRRWAYLNHAGICPLPQPSVDAMHRRATEVSLHGDLELVFDDTARRLEGGMPNVTGIAALGASIDLLRAASIPAIWSHVDHLCDLACEGLASIGATVLSDRSPDGRSGIIAVHLDGPPMPLLAKQLQAEGIAVSARAGGLRAHRTATTTKRISIDWSTPWPRSSAPEIAEQSTGDAAYS
ncbi:aminotransferase class V-fold PLP-dependent enzyme [Nocardia sp. NBC_01499]|uniref:aminotransferase class V-fold PLP-dependent enzyme n=1 Tax=Nocardia sp. NBC_01499 TaxID=2903597 RepID=UPI003870256E